MDWSGRCDCFGVPQHTPFKQRLWVGRRWHNGHKTYATPACATTSTCLVKNNCAVSTHAAATIPPTPTFLSLQAALSAVSGARPSEETLKARLATARAEAEAARKERDALRMQLNMAQGGPMPGHQGAIMTGPGNGMNGVGGGTVVGAQGWGMQQHVGQPFASAASLYNGGSDSNAHHRIQLQSHSGPNGGPGQNKPGAVTGAANSAGLYPGSYSAGAGVGAHPSFPQYGYPGGPGTAPAAGVGGLVGGSFGALQQQQPGRQQRGPLGGGGVGAGDVAGGRGAAGSGAGRHMQAAGAQQEAGASDAGGKAAKVPRRVL